MKKIFKIIYKKITHEKAQISICVCDAYFENNKRYFSLYNEIMK